jgi:hypothetical protein
MAAHAQPPPPPLASRGARRARARGAARRGSIAARARGRRRRAPWLLNS